MNATAPRSTGTSSRRWSDGEAGGQPLGVLELGALDDGRDAALVVVAGLAGIRAELRVVDARGAHPAGTGDGAMCALVRRWSSGRDADGFRCDWQGDAVDPRLERQVSTDHANLSVATDDVLVKVLRRPAAASRASELTHHLTDVGFDAVPQPRGELSWLGTPDETIIALASRYLADAQEGWARFRDLASASLSRGTWAEEDRRTITTLGELVARFHLAMATPSVSLPTPERAATSVDRAAWHRRATSNLVEALAEVGEPALTHLRRQAADLRGQLAGFVDEDEATPLVHVHGDLHVGQVLTAGGRLYLTDLDGDPSADPGTADTMSPAARDVASLLRSLDHVGRLAARRATVTDDLDVDAWIDEARAVCLDAYRQVLVEHGRHDLLDDRLLGPFEAAQIVHELLYATRRLPTWMPTAEAALRARSDRRLSHGS